MNEIEAFYAVDESGQGKIFAEEPYRNSIYGVWQGKSAVSISSILWRLESLGFILPKITWEDKPIKLKLSLTYE